MPVDYGLISDTLNNVTTNVTLSTVTPQSELVEVQDSEMRKRTLKRVIIILAMLGIITYLILKKKK